MTWSSKTVTPSSVCCSPFVALKPLCKPALGFPPSSRPRNSATQRCPRDTTSTCGRYQSRPRPSGRPLLRCFAVFVSSSSTHSFPSRTVGHWSPSPIFGYYYYTTRHTALRFLAALSNALLVARNAIGVYSGLQKTTFIASICSAALLHPTFYLLTIPRYVPPVFRLSYIPTLTVSITTLRTRPSYWHTHTTTSVPSLTYSTVRNTPLIGFTDAITPTLRHTALNAIHFFSTSHYPHLDMFSV